MAPEEGNSEANLTTQRNRRKGGITPLYRWVYGNYPSRCPIVLLSGRQVAFSMAKCSRGGGVN